MSSALRTEPPSRNWWPLASKSSKQDLHKQYASDKLPTSLSKSSSARSFPSFASVIGRKPKKHPTLAIQEPPSPLKPSYSTSHKRQDIPPQFYPELQSRSSLKSPQPISPTDSIEVVTPVDSFREGRQSLLTLSDNDPFAVRCITVHTPTSPTNLSTHSNNSFLDVNSKQDKSSLYVRGSYSSSSSQSHSPREPQHQPPSFLKVNKPTAEIRTLSSSKSLSNLQRKPSHVDPEPPLPTGYHSQPNSRPPTRSRGMTESGPIRPPFLQETYSVMRQRRPSSPGKPPSVSRGTTSLLLPSLIPGSQSPGGHLGRPASAGQSVSNQLASATLLTKPQTVSRQVSIQRLQPPTAPPTHELPAPPPKVTGMLLLEDDLDIPPACNSSISSSSLSFVSSFSSGKEVNGSFDRGKGQGSDLEQWSFVTNLRPEPELDATLIPSSSKSRPDMSNFPRTVGKVSSHCYSPLKRLPGSQTSTMTSSEPLVEVTKTVRKQRSHHRLGIPPISLGFKHGPTTSISTPSSPHLSEPPIPPNLDQRRSSTTSHVSVPIIPVRKRVFSGSSGRRPSTSSGVPTPANEDDARSLFSVRSDQEFFANASPFKPWPTNMSTLGSFWEDQAPPSPVRSDYLPQAIMSPEDLAKVEAELDDISIVSALPPPSVPLHSTRQRTMSASTVLSDRDSEIIPSSIFSQSLSESIKSPQMSVRSIKSTTPSLNEVGGVLGNGIGRTASMISKPSAPPQVNRRPATASGSMNLGPVAPMSTIHEPEALENPKTAAYNTSGPVTGDATSTAPLSPLNIRKVQRKNSNASKTNPPPQLKSLPPPPRPRAKAEVVTVAESQKNPAIEVRFGGGVRNSIGVDFGHDQRYGHVVSPSIQLVSTNHGYHISPPQAPPSSHCMPPMPPPRAASRLPPSYRKPQGVVTNSQQQISSNSGVSKASRRMSLQRKPSFLDIDDDDDAGVEGDLDFHAIMRMSSTSSGVSSFTRSDRATPTESFLEFGRESFDTIRSAE